MAAPCANGRLRMIPLDGGKEKTVAIKAGAFNPAALSPDGRRLVTSNACIDVQKAKKVWAPARPFLSAVYMPDGKGLVVSFNFGVARVTAATGKIHDDLSPTSQAHSGSIGALAISGDGKTLATGCNSGTLALTDLGRSGASPREKSLSPIAAVAFGREGLAVAVKGPDLLILSSKNLSSKRTLKLPESARGHESETRALAFAADGVTLFAACHARFPKGQYERADAYLIVWDTVTGEERLRWRFEPGMFVYQGLALSADGRTVALATIPGVYVCTLPERL